MLVKRSIVETWYQRNSWVYRNFEFLFKNPLWNTKVPSGFSVCPYFWLSLFSLFVLRPFVFGLTRIVVPLLALGGLPLKALDQWIGVKIVGEKGYSRGLGVVLCIGAATLLFLAGYIGHAVWAGYQLLVTVPGGALACWLLLSGAATSIAVYSYEHKNRHRSDRCKAKIWLVVWLVAAISLAIGSNPLGFLGFLKGCAGWCWEAVASVGWAIGVAATWCAKMLWLAIKMAALAVWTFLSYIPFPQLYLPWWAYFLGITWVMARIGDRVLQACGDSALPPNQPSTVDRAKLDRELNRTSWKQLLRSAYQQDGLKEMILDQMENELVTSPQHRSKFGITHWNWKLMPAVLRFEVNDVLDMFIETRYGHLLDRLEAQKPLMTFWSWSQLSTSVKRDSKLEAIHNTVIKPALEGLEDKNELELWWLNHSINSGVHSDETAGCVQRWFNELTAQQATRVRALHDCYVSAAAAEEREREARWAAAQNSWSARTCKRVTESVWAGMLATGHGIGKAWFQVKVFAVYLWELLKARKQGACPYIMFRD